MNTDMTLPTGARITIRQSENIAAFAGAMAKAQLEMGTAKKNAVNPHFKNRYADLEAVMDVARAPLAKNGIAFLQPPMITPEGAGVVTKLIHSSGEWMECELLLPLTQRSAQAAGSCITYARRYGASAMLGIPTGEGEDDGNEASRDEPKEEGRKEAPRQQAAKTSRTSEVKATLTTQAELWSKVVGIGAMFGKSEDQMKTFARTVLGGSRQLKGEDVATIHDALAMIGKPIVGQDAAGQQ